MNISKAIAYLSRDEVKAVKETAHVGIGVLGFHHLGNLVKKSMISTLINFYMSAPSTLSQLKAVPKAPALTPVRTN